MKPNNPLPHPEVVDSKTLQLLEEIQGNPIYDQFYLAGGTSLALQIGHRISDDLDLFTRTDFKANISKGIPYKFEVSSMQDNNIELFVDGVKTLFMYFAYPLYKPVKLFLPHLRLVDPVDVGLMKLLAVSGRTTRKDIIDLYFIDKEVIPLHELMTIFEDFYPEDSKNSYDSARRLLDREVLDAQPMPKMLKACEWDTCYAEVSEKILNFYRKNLK